MNTEIKTIEAFLDKYGRNALGNGIFTGALYVDSAMSIADEIRMTQTAMNLGLCDKNGKLTEYGTKITNRMNA